MFDFLKLTHRHRLHSFGLLHPLMAVSVGVGARSLPAFPTHSPNPLRLSNSSIKLHTFFSSSPLSLTSPLPPLSINNFSFQLNSALEEATVQETQQINSDEKKRKLFVVNLPWGFSIEDVKKLFGECGTVKDVEIIKAKDGRHKGFSFITMSSAEEAQAVVQKFDSYELSGRIIRVEFAKRLKKPSPPPPAGTPVVETRHKLYVSNLAWKARSSHLREFFSAECNPVSARVVFDRPFGGSAGYGFVSFSTHEEAEAAISSMDGKELMGRAVRLKFSEKNIDGSESELKDDSVPDGQLKETEDIPSTHEES